MHRRLLNPEAVRESRGEASDNVVGRREATARSEGRRTLELKRVFVRGRVGFRESIEMVKSRGAPLSTVTGRSDAAEICAEAAGGSETTFFLRPRTCS